MNPGHQSKSDTFEQHAGSFDPVVVATKHLDKHEVNIAVVVDTIAHNDPEYIKKVNILFTAWRDELEKHKAILSRDMYKQYTEKIDSYEQILLNPTK